MLAARSAPDARDETAPCPWRRSRPRPPWSRRPRSFRPRVRAAAAAAAFAAKPASSITGVTGPCHDCPQIGRIGKSRQVGLDRIPERRAPANAHRCKPRCHRFVGQVHEVAWRSARQVPRGSKCAGARPILAKANSRPARRATASARSDRTCRSWRDRRRAPAARCRLRAEIRSDSEPSRLDSASPPAPTSSGKCAKAGTAAPSASKISIWAAVLVT